MLVDSGIYPEAHSVYIMRRKQYFYYIGNSEDWLKFLCGLSQLDLKPQETELFTAEKLRSSWNMDLHFICSQGDQLTINWSPSSRLINGCLCQFLAVFKKNGFIWKQSPLENKIFINKIILSEHYYLDREVGFPQLEKGCSYERQWK